MEVRRDADVGREAEEVGDRGVERQPEAAREVGVLDERELGGDTQSTTVVASES